MVKFIFFQRRPFSLLLSTVLLFILTAALAWPGRAQSQDNPTTALVYVEAIKTANVRTGPSLEYTQIGTITAGTKYRLVGRSAHARWYLIDMPNSLGWVYVDVVTVTGDINSVPFDEEVLTYVTPGPGNAVNAPQAAASPAGSANTPTGTIYVTPTLPTSTGVMAQALATVVVRYGPGEDFPRVGRIDKGQTFAVLRRHTRFQWLEIAYPGGPAGRGWVYQQSVQITGDLNNVPATGDSSFNYPTLTPTPNQIATYAPAWTITPVAGPNEVLEKLSNDVYAYLLAQHFEPGTERQGAVFVMNLQTGHMFSVNPNVAFSATNLMKLPILVALYRKLNDVPPSEEQAKRIASMMICDQTAAMDGSLVFLGDGDLARGIGYVMETMQHVGLTHTNLARPFANPSATPIPNTWSQPGADVQSARPDPANQTTPADLGWLLNGIYQCAVDEKGPLSSAYPSAFTSTACRQMVNVMRANKIRIMIEAGAPESLAVAHVQGWNDDTHGDAGLIISPGGDYVLVVVLHADTRLGFDSSAPTIAEISRMTYNVFNASRALAAIHPKAIPECSYGPDLISSLRSSDAPAIR